MAKLHLLWDFIVSHWFEIVLAVFLAVIAELLGIGSRLRTVIRRIKNKLSERSVGQLRKRIKLLETQRDRYAAYSSSDKALYLATFTIVIGMLLAIATGAALAELSDILPPSPLGIMAVFFYILAIIIGIQGFEFSSLDTRAKVSEMVAKLESEIADLKKKARGDGPA
jgi:hypothetical protein